MGRTILAVFGAVLGCYALIATAAIHYAGYSLKDLTSPLLSLMATFIGALFAFRLSQLKEDEKEHAKRRDAINRTCFLLSVQANAIRQIKSAFEKYSTPFQRAFRVPAIKAPSYDEIRLNFSELEFILSSDQPQVLLELAVEFQRFHQAIVAVNLRSEFYVSRYLPKIAEIGQDKFEGTPEHLRAILGDEIYLTLLQNADGILQHLQDSYKSIPETQAKLLALAKKIYPDKKFISFRIEDLPPSPV